jgi:predicted LPLAT superfamily acyltransferase
MQYHFTTHLRIAAAGLLAITGVFALVVADERRPNKQYASRPQRRVK